MPTAEAPRVKYDLEERTFLFAKTVASFTKNIPRDIANIEYAKQLIRSSGSIAANYLEANDNLGKKDFILHIKISRKEAKESRLWLRLIDAGTNEHFLNEQIALQQEAKELVLIFAAILRNVGGKVL